MTSDWSKNLKGGPKTSSVPLPSSFIAHTHNKICLIYGIRQLT